MDWSPFIDWGIKGVIAACAGYGVHVLSKLQSSVEELNINVAVIIARVESHEKRIDRLEDKKTNE